MDQKFLEWSEKVAEQERSCPEATEGSCSLQCTSKLHAVESLCQTILQRLEIAENKL